MNFFSSDRNFQGPKASPALPLEWSKPRGWGITCVEPLGVLVHPVGNSKPTVDGEAKDKEVSG